MARRGEAGFSLIEVMAALAVFSIAAIALMHVSGENARASARLEEATIGRIVAENVLIEATLSRSPPVLGVEEGETRMAGAQWAWRREIAATPNPALRRIEVAVRLSGAESEAARLTGFVDS